MTLTKFAPEIRAVNSDGVGDINAVAAKTATAQQRLANLNAAASATNPKLKEAYAFAQRGVQRLGFSLDQIAEAGGVRQLDAAMTEKHWSTQDRIALKSALASISIIP